MLYILESNEMLSIDVHSNWIIKMNSSVNILEVQWAVMWHLLSTVTLSGCEVEILGVRPSFCEEYVYNPTERNLTDSIERALDGLR